MNGFEINKIIAAIIFTVLVVFGIDKVTDLIFYVEKPKEAAYVVEAPVAKTAVSTAGSDGLNIKDFLALGDIEHGKAVFKNVLLATWSLRVEKIKLDQFYMVFLEENLEQYLIINILKL